VAQPKTSPNVEAEILDLVRNEIILKPDVASNTIAKELWEQIGEQIDTEYLITELTRLLVRRYLVKIIMAERRKARPKREILPLFAHLELPVPQRIATAEGKRPLLAKSTATDIRAYVKTLNSRHREKVAGLQAVLEIMERYLRRDNRRGMTAGEVARLDEQPERIP
jgi:hypothetical protein